MRRHRGRPLRQWLRLSSQHLRVQIRFCVTKRRDPSSCNASSSPSPTLADPRRHPARRTAVGHKSPPASCRGGSCPSYPVFRPRPFWPDLTCDNQAVHESSADNATAVQRTDPESEIAPVNHGSRQAPQKCHRYHRTQGACSKSADHPSRIVPALSKAPWTAASRPSLTMPSATIVPCTCA